MGSIVSRSMEEHSKKNQEFMMQMHMIQLERQIQTQNEMRKRVSAMQLARSRELFYWLGTFYVVATIAMFAGYKKSLKASTLSPLLPLTFMVAYQADLAYGSKMHRIRGEAENIMQFESSLLELPLSVPTVTVIEDARERQHEKENLQRAHDIFL